MTSRRAPLGKMDWEWYSPEGGGIRARRMAKRKETRRRCCKMMISRIGSEPGPGARFKDEEGTSSAYLIATTGHAEGDGTCPHRQSRRYMLSYATMQVHLLAPSTPVKAQFMRMTRPGRGRSPLTTVRNLLFYAVYACLYPKHPKHPKPPVRDFRNHALTPTHAALMPCRTTLPYPPQAISSTYQPSLPSRQSPLLAA
jgi:hypothetical protein